MVGAVEAETYPSRFRIGQVVISLAVHFEIIEAHEGTFVVVVENRRSLPCCRINSRQIC